MRKALLPQVRCPIHLNGTAPCRINESKEKPMKAHRALTIAALALVAVALIATAGCKTGGMALTGRGQLLKINITHPTDLPEQGEDNLNIVLGNRGVNSMRDLL